MNDILVGRNDTTAVELDPHFGNRHGMIAGATSTGKTVSLMVLAEGFSRLGTPVFMADAKGDIAGMSQPAASPPSDKLKARLAKLGLDKSWQPQANPVVLWDLYGKLGSPVHATVSEMGPMLLARVLDLNDTQQGVLEIVFKLADDNGWLLLELDDLRALLDHVGDNAKEVSQHYGLVSKSSLGAVQRTLLQLEQQGAAQFFGEPALDLKDIMRQDMSGRGIINILAADGERATIRSRSPVGPKYDTPVNREPAAEMLAKRADEKAVDDPREVAQDEAAKAPQGSAWGGAMHDAIFGTKRRQGMLETMAKQTVRTMGSQLGRQILRGVLGGIFGGKR